MATAPPPPPMATRKRVPPPGKGKVSPLPGSDSESTSSSASHSSPSSASDSESGSEVELSFTSYNVDKTRDYHPIHQFLGVTFGRGLEGEKGGSCGKVNVTRVCSLIVDVLSEYIGTTAKSAEDGDLLAFTSLIPLVADTLEAEMGEDGRAQLAELCAVLRGTALKSQTLGKKERARLDDMLDRGRTGLVLYERFLNLPAELGAPLYQQLLDDLQPAIEESRAFDVEHVFLLTPVYRELAPQTVHEGSSSEQEEGGAGQSGSAGGMGPPRKRGKFRNRQEQAEIDAFQYYYAESELAAGLAEFSWDFRVRTPHETSDSRRAFGDRGVDPARRVFVLTMDAFRSFVEQAWQLARP